MKTLQDQYKLILEGKGNKNLFLNQVKRLFPNYFNQYTDYNSAVRVLKGKRILTEETQETPEFDPLKDMPNLFNYKDQKNIDNLNFNEILKGFYCEMGDVDNLSKTVDELIKIVTDNLSKDPLYYVKNGQFGLKNVGYTNTASGSSKIPQEAKGKYKSSGMTELKESLIREDKKEPKENLSFKSLFEESLSFPDDWDSMKHPNYPEMHKGNKYGLFKTEEDDGGNVETGMIDSNDNIEDLIVTAKEEYMNENNIEFDDIPLDKNGLPPGYHIDELNYDDVQQDKEANAWVDKQHGGLKEAWEGAEFDTGKFDDGPQPKIEVDNVDDKIEAIIHLAEKVDNDGLLILVKLILGDDSLDYFDLEDNVTWNNTINEIRYTLNHRFSTAEVNDLYNNLEKEGLL